MKAKKRLRTQLNKYQRFGVVIPGTIGDHIHVIDVPGRANYIYVSLSNGEVIEAFNNRVSPILDLPVFVGYDPKEPNLLQVLSVRSGYARYGDGGVSMPSVPEHHETHEWMANPGGNDVVFAQLRQFMPLRPTPLSTGVALNIYRSVGYLNNQWLQFTGSTIDLAPFIPTTGTRFVLIYEGADGLPSATAGTSRDSYSLLGMDDIPQPIPGTLPIAVARVYFRQQVLYETNDYTDLIDLRFPMWHDHPQYVTGTSAGGAPSDAQYVTLTNDATLTQERALRAGTRISLNDTGANGDIFVSAQEALPIYDDSIFMVSGSAISFDDDLEISVTGSIVYVNRVDTVPWTPYHDDSNIVGWESFTSKYIYYGRLGNKVLCMFSIAGTSNATGVTFTLPYTVNNGFNVTLPVALVQDSGTIQTLSGRIDLVNGSATITVYKTLAAGAFTASGAKMVRGEFWYYTTQAP